MRAATKVRQEHCYRGECERCCPGDEQIAEAVDDRSDTAARDHSGQATPGGDADEPRPTQHAESSSEQQHAGTTVTRRKSPFRQHREEADHPRSEPEPGLREQEHLDVAVRSGVANGLDRVGDRPHGLTGRADRPARRLPSHRADEQPGHDEARSIQPEGRGTAELAGDDRPEARPDGEHRPPDR